MVEETKSVHWQPFNGRGEQLSETLNLPSPPPWRNFDRPIPAKDTERRSNLLKLVESEKTDRDRGEKFRLSEIADNKADLSEIADNKADLSEIADNKADLSEIADNETNSQNAQLQEAIDLVIAGVNSALCLRRPLLVTGRPGSGKTSLAYALAYQLRLGPVLKWSITARTTLQDGLYRYDAIARLQEPDPDGKQDIGSYITLGALGTAFLPSALPRVLLIDEIDKSDINLPNDLLNLFEEGEYEIPELKRWTEKNRGKTVSVFTGDKNLPPVELNSGIVGCNAFPIVVMTSNGERDFPPAFKRRCIRINMPNPGINNLISIVKSHMGDEYFNKSSDRIGQLITDFLDRKDLATDQLLNVVYMLTDGAESTLVRKSLTELLLKSLNDTEGL